VAVIWHCIPGGQSSSALLCRHMTSSASASHDGRHVATCGPPSRFEIFVMQQNAFGQSAAPSQRIVALLHGMSWDVQLSSQQYSPAAHSLPGPLAPLQRTLGGSVMDPSLPVPPLPPMEPSLPPPEPPLPPPDEPPLPPVDPLAPLPPLADASSFLEPALEPPALPVVFEASLSSAHAATSANAYAIAAVLSTILVTAAPSSLPIVLGTVSCADHRPRILVSGSAFSVSETHVLSGTIQRGENIVRL
jgi:hypothetical protein